MPGSGCCRRRYFDPGPPPCIHRVNCARLVAERLRLCSAARTAAPGSSRSSPPSWSGRQSRRSWLTWAWIRSRRPRAGRTSRHCTSLPEPLALSDTYRHGLRLPCSRQWRCALCRQAMANTRVSCKRRGFCPSCGARRMAQTAAHLVEHVIPRVPVRQWVLALPIPLRLLLAAQPVLVTSVLVQPPHPAAHGSYGTAAT